MKLIIFCEKFHTNFGKNSSLFDDLHNCFQNLKKFRKILCFNKEFLLNFELIQMSVYNFSLKFFEMFTLK